jgi:hypothetical protein
VAPDTVLQSNRTNSHQSDPTETRAGDHMIQTEVSRWGHFLACATDPLAQACADFASHCQRT